MQLSQMTERRLVGWMFIAAAGVLLWNILTAWG